MREPHKAPESALKTAAIDRPGTVDCDLARLLSNRVGEDSRLAFARSFTFAAVKAWWRALNAGTPLLPLPKAVERIRLSGEAAEAAEKFGGSLAGLQPHIATYRVGTAYTSSLPEAYRGTNGIYYTPPELVERLLLMVEETGISWDTARVLDPACGCGAFLVPVAMRMAAALKGTAPAFVLQQLATRLHGFDVDPFGAWLAQVTLEIALNDLTKAAGYRMPTVIETRDSLDLNDADKTKFDLVVGNPPYGRVSLSEQKRAAFARSVYGHANLYGLFTDAALHWVKKGGVIAYVTPTSMLSGLYYKALRTLLAEEAPPVSITFVHERTGVFRDVLQETMLATYRRTDETKSGKVGFIEIGTDGKAAFRKGGTFRLPIDREAPWILPRSGDQAALTNRLRAMPHRLKDYGYGVSTGPLVWNRFKDQYASQPTKGAFPVIWAESVTSDGRFILRSEKRNHAPWFRARLPKDRWLIVDRPCVLLQRTTAKEQARRLIAAELPESVIRKHKGVIVENHLNMVRSINSNPAVPAAVIAALLNSAAVDAAFRCINGSVAVSAFELEELPLPSPASMKALARLVAANAPAEKVEAEIAGAYGRADVGAAT